MIVTSLYPAAVVVMLFWHNPCHRRRLQTPWGSPEGVQNTSRTVFAID